MTSTCRLVDPSTGATLVSYASVGNNPDGILTSLDLGFPAVREVSASRSGGHGTLDTTRWMGARAITAEIVMPEQPSTDIAVDNLAAVLNPSLRLYLYAQRDGWLTERRTLVRGATLTVPPGVMRTAQAGWVSPSGLFEDSVQQQVVLSPFGGGVGWTGPPLVPPLVLTGGMVAGSALINVGGSAEAPLTIDMYGPCQNPYVQIIDTGQRIGFTNLTLAAGDYAHIDTGARTATLNSDPTNSLYARLDFANSSWFALPPGRQVQAQFSATAPVDPCNAVLSWRSTYV